MRQRKDRVAVVVARVATVVALTAGVVAPTQAQGENGGCKDILVDGPYSYTQFTNNVTFMQIVYSEFMQSTYTSSKESTVAGLKVPVGKLVMGGDYNEQEYNDKKTELQTSNYSRIETANFTTSLVSSGDPVIAKAWSECMDKRYGVFMTLESIDPTVARASIEYRLPAGGESQRLERNIVLPPGVTVRSGGDCLKRNGYVYKHRAPCPVTFDLARASTPLFLEATIGGTTANAFLPPRVKLEEEIDDFKFAARDTLVAGVTGTPRDYTNVVNMPAKLRQEGWRFDGSNSKVLFRLVTTHAGDENNSCYQPTVKIRDNGVQLWFFFTAGPRSSCRMEPIVQIKRMRWVELKSGIQHKTLAG